MVDSENPEKVLRRIEQLHESGTSTIAPRQSILRRRTFMEGALIVEAF